jgi:cell wall-associated NlpC family hydrolase
LPVTVSTTGARHRAARRPSTPLTTFGQVITGPAARRSMAVAASSGLAITMAASTAIANPEGTAAALPQVDVAALSAQARTALVSPTVSVPADVEFTVEAPQAVATPPKTTAKADPIVRRVEEIAAAEAAAEAEAAAAAAAAVAARSTEVASRSGARSEVPAAAQAAPAPAQNVASGSVIDIAYRYVGTPYVWGGSTPAGFDCSGFTSYVYAQVGISLPRSSSAQRNAGTVVSAADARPGDLVWWPGHVGIYLGGGDYIAAHSVGNPLSARPIFKSNPTFIRVG